MPNTPFGQKSFEQPNLRATIFPDGMTPERMPKEIAEEFVSLGDYPQGPIDYHPEHWTLVRRHHQVSPETHWIRTGHPHWVLAPLSMEARVFLVMAIQHNHNETVFTEKKEEKP